MSINSRAAAAAQAFWLRHLPDARSTRYPHTSFLKKWGPTQRVYCVNCGKPGGEVAEAYVAHVFYLCDDCVFLHGKLPLPEIDLDQLQGG